MHFITPLSSVAVRSGLLLLLFNVCFSTAFVHSVDVSASGNVSVTEQRETDKVFSTVSNSFARLQVKMETLRFYFVTWNVATQQPEENVAEMIGLNKERLPDFYIIGLQEVKAQPQNLLINALFDDPWNNNFKDALTAKDFVKIRSIRLQGLLLSVFCKRKHLLRVRDIETQYTRTGLGGMWGNKGAVSVRMLVSGVSLCLVNCHFSAHDYMRSERIAEYNTVLQSHTYSTARETTHILYHDYVFWLGDLNFRMISGSNGDQLSAENINSMISRGELAQLLEFDELKDVMRNGEAFSELSEPNITFAPTYKFNSRSTVYDLKRRPAWTDRILYRVTPDVYENLTLEAQPVSYRSWNNYVQSDHKPVTAEYTVKVFRDHHDRVVDFNPISLWYLDEENIVTFSYSRDVDPSSGNDWIGIYRENFSNLEDYLFYVYVPRAPTLSGHVHVTFPDAALTEPGPYRLLYLTQNSASVLGMSEPFSVISRDTDMFQLQNRPRF